MKRIIALLLLVFANSIAVEQVIKYQNDQICECDSIHNEYYSTGSLWKEIPYKDGKVIGEIYEYDRNGVLIFDNDDGNSKTIDSSSAIVSSKVKDREAIPNRFLFIFGLGYFTDVHYLGVEFGLGYLGDLNSNKQFGVGWLATVIYANSCEEDDYDKANIDISEYNKKGDKGYSYCRTGKGAGIRLGVLNNFGGNAVLAYSGGIVYSNKILIQNDDSILGKYTGSSGKEQRTEFVIPVGLLYQTNSHFGFALEFKTDKSVGIVTNVALDM